MCARTEIAPRGLVAVHTPDENDGIIDRVAIRVDNFSPAARKLTRLRNKRTTPLYRHETTVIGVLQPGVRDKSGSSYQRSRQPAGRMKVTPNMARLTMEYPSVDVQGGRRLHSVRRRLFQDEEEDRDGESSRNSGVEDNLANCFFEEARKNRENAKERWNFDFEKEEPLPGRYVWVKLDEHGNEVGNPLETRNRVENLQILQDEDAQDDDFAMQDQPEDKDDEKMTDST